MTSRKKRGVGFFISGALFVVAGGIFTFATSTPDWLTTGMSIVGLVANALGFVIVFPDVKEE